MYFPRFTGESITTAGGKTVRQCAIMTQGAQERQSSDTATGYVLTESIEILTLDYKAARDIHAGDIITVRGLKWRVMGEPFAQVSVFGTGAAGIQLTCELLGQPGANIPEIPNPLPEEPGNEPSDSDESEEEPTPGDMAHPDYYTVTTPEMDQFIEEKNLASRENKAGVKLIGAVHKQTGDFSTDRFNWYREEDIPPTHYPVYSVDVAGHADWKKEPFRINRTGFGDNDSKGPHITWNPGYIFTIGAGGGAIKALGHLDEVEVGTAWDAKTGRRLADYRTGEVFKPK